MMLITIAICTHNRAESLRRTLTSLLMVRVPKTIDWEVVVVNNRCRDHTDTVITEFSSRLPVRREFEQRLGLSNARNRAIDAAKGDYILWTDDDVIVDRNWVAAYVEAFREWRGAAVFGGPIIPKYEKPTPRWVIEGEAMLGGPYALRDFGHSPVLLSIHENRIPFGANFAFRAAEQREFRYNVDWGLRGEVRRGGEEIDAIKRTLSSGATGYWVPAAKVEHCIGRERQRTRYLVRYFTAIGAMDAQRSVGYAIGRNWLGVPLWTCRQFAEEWVRYRWHRWTSPSPVWLRHLQAYAYAIGAMKFYWRSRRLKSIA